MAQNNYNWEGFDPDYNPYAQDNSPEAPQPYQPPGGKDPWGNDVGSQQNHIDSFWDASTNQKRNDFSDAELGGWGVSRLGADKYLLPNGQTVDTVRDIGGANAPSWTISGGKQGENGQGVNWGGQQGGGGGFQGLGNGLGPMVNQGGGAGDDSWITGGLQDVFKQAMETINKPVGSAQFEAIRNPIDKARRTANNQNSAELASRGMLSGSGEALNAAGRTEEKLAPAFATAVQNASVENSNNAFKNALGALQGGTQHKQVAGQLALGQLDQNRQWNQFLGDFGLKRAQVEDMINSGHIDDLLEYYKTWSNGNMGG